MVKSIRRNNKFLEDIFFIKLMMTWSQWYTYENNENEENKNEKSQDLDNIEQNIINEKNCDSDEKIILNESNQDKKKDKNMQIKNICNIGS